MTTAALFALALVGVKVQPALDGVIVTAPNRPALLQLPAASVPALADPLLKARETPSTAVPSLWVMRPETE